MVGGSLAMKMESDGASRLSERPRMAIRDELWRHLATVNARRSEAVQCLHNLAASLDAQSQRTSFAAPGRVLAFRSLTGIATDSGGCWPPPQADFYILCLHALFPAWARQPRSQYEITLSAEHVT